MDKKHSPIQSLGFWYKNNKLLSYSLAFFGTIGLAVLGNFAYEWLRDIGIPWLGSTQPANWIILGIIITIGALIGLVFGIILTLNSNYFSRFNNTNGVRTVEKYYQDIHSLNSHKLRMYWLLMIEINKLIQNSLGNKTTAVLNQFIRNYFYLIFEYLGSACVRAGSILLVKEDDNNYLYMWRASGNKKGVSEKQFYIGSDLEENGCPPRGTAGVVFLEDKYRIVNIQDQKAGNADDPSYHRFNVKPTSPYDTFVAIPIHWGDKVVGVLTIESIKKYTFQDDDMPMLQTLSDRLGNILFHFNIIR